MVHTFAVDVQNRENADPFLFAYYTQTIQKAFKEGLLDRAVVSDSLAPAQLDGYELPEKAYRLYTSRNRRYDKIKRIRYSLKKGIPVLAGFRQIPPDAPLRGQSHWDGEGEDGRHVMIVTGYDSKTYSFQLLNTFGPDWGEQGFIWMTYQDFINKAKEILTLKDPNLVSTPKTTEQKAEVSINATASVFHLQQPESREPFLAPLAVKYDASTGVYRFPEHTGNSDFDRYQLQIHLPKGRCAYLFSIHPDGRTTPAWYQEYSDKDTTVVLPPVSYYQFQDTGREYLVLLVSNAPFPFWRKYVDYYEYNERSLTPKEKLYKVFERFLITPGAIDYAENEISFSTRWKPEQKKKVVPIILEWEMH